MTTTVYDLLLGAARRAWAVASPIPVFPPVMRTMVLVRDSFSDAMSYRAGGKLERDEAGALIVSSPEKR